MTTEAMFRALFWVLCDAVLLMHVSFVFRLRQAGQRVLPDEQTISYEGKGLFAFRPASWFLVIGNLVSHALDLAWMDSFSIAGPDWLRWAGSVSSTGGTCSGPGVCCPRGARVDSRIRAGGR